MEQTLHLVHSSEGGSLHLLVLPVNQDKVDHGGQHGVGVLVLVTPGVSVLNITIVKPTPLSSSPNLKVDSTLVCHQGLEMNHLVSNGSNLLGIVWVFRTFKIFLLLHKSKQEQHQEHVEEDC